MKENSIVKKILVGLAVGAGTVAITAAFAVMPGAGLAWKTFAKWYDEQNRRKQYQVRRTFAQLQRSRFITLVPSPDGATKVVLTEHGKKRLLEYKLDDMQIPPMARWDKKWRLVIFDIPESCKQARNALRKKIQELGFQQLQKSVWIHPYECRNEIDFITELFQVSAYVRMAEATHIDGEQFLKQHFKLA